MKSSQLTSKDVIKTIEERHNNHKDILKYLELFYHYIIFERDLTSGWNDYYYTQQEACKLMQEIVRRERLINVT